VTGAAAEVLVLVPVTADVAEPDPVLVAAEVPGPGPVAELVLMPVTAEVTGATTEVTRPEPDPEVGAAGGRACTVAACAWRENTSKMTRIPAAAIATCIARRAICRKIGCAMSNSRTTGTRPDLARVPIVSGLKHVGAPIVSGLFRRGHPEPDIAIRPRMYVLFGHHRTVLA
jgi:hypothetical protein